MGQTTFDREVERLLRAFRRRRPMRAQSLIVTMLGDVASVHGGVIWLGSLIAALEPFGVAERLTRTSVFRLNKDGWIDLKRRGRRSYVQFSTHGRREYDRTASRIYAASRPAWDGNWTLVLARDVPRARSYAFRKALGWVGYGELTTGLYAHPSADRRTLIDLLDELELQDAVVVMSAQTPELASQHRLTARIQAAWRLPALARGYREFVKRFAVLVQASVRHAAPSSAFAARTLAIHAYRRLLLQDPDIPDELLGTEWPGNAALALISRLYRAVGPQSLSYIRGELEGGNGPLPAAAAAYRARFAPAVG